MIVAVVAVRMMQVALHEVVDMVTMRDRGVPASRTVHMSFLMSTAGMPPGTAVRMGGVDLDDMFVHVTGMGMVQVPVVQVVDVVAVLDGGVTATRAVLVRMVGMNVALVHRMIGWGSSSLSGGR